MKKLTTFMKKIACIMLVSLCIGEIGTAMPVKAENYQGEDSNLSSEVQGQTLEQSLNNTGLQDVVFEEVDMDNTAVETAENTDIQTMELQTQTSDWKKYSGKFYYNQLSGSERTLYDRLEAAAIYYMESTDNLNGDIGTISCEDLGISRDRAQFITWVFYQSESQYYYLENVIRIGYSSDLARNVSVRVYDVFNNGNTRMNYTNLFRQQIQQWINDINGYSTVYGRVKRAHDIICENVSYVYGNYDQSAVSAVLNSDGFNRSTVCAGYAKAFQILCNGSGVQADIVISTSHAWNIVAIGNAWYYVDCTYDKSFYGYGLRPYLAVSESSLQSRDTNSAHVAKAAWKAYLPACPSDYDESKDAFLSKNGVFMGADGNWYYYTNGLINWNYTGIAANETGWWRIENGMVNFNFTGLASNEYGWWRVENGAVNFGFTGLTSNEFGWWYVQNGGIDFNFNGVVPNEYGWWCVKGGQVDFGYTGIASNETGWWRIENGMVNFNYTGVAQNEFGWWRVENGAVNFGFNGLAQNKFGWWYIVGGGVDFGYNGQAWNEFGQWNVRGGQVIF